MTIFRSTSARVLVLFFFHAVVFSLCYVLSWMIRFEFEMRLRDEALMFSSLPFVVGVQLILGAAFGFYRGWWRYVGITDVVRLVAGITFSLLALLGAWYAGASFGLIERWVRVPRSVLLIDWAFALLALFGARVAIRIGRDHTRFQATHSAVKKVLIIGAGDAGETLAREIEHRPQLGMRVVSFVDDYRGKLGSSIRGIAIRGPISDVATIAADTGAQEALIAIPSASGRRLREIVHHLSEAGLQFQTIPGMEQLMTGKVVVSQLRPVKIDDLLRRGEIELPGDPVRELFQGKRVIVTGAGGTIGSEVSAQILDFDPAALHLVERSEFALYEIDKRLRNEKAWMKGVVHRHLLDVRDTADFTALLRQHEPEIVIHAAAHKHVPLGEENALEYLRNNTLATRRIAQDCEAAGVERFVFISTDKAINPTSVMGATKRAAEILLMDLARSSRMSITAVRFGNVLGSSGSAVPLFMEQIAAGGPITVTHPDVTRYFLRTSEAVSLVLQAATLGEEKHGCVMMLDMGEPIRIADLARHMIELSGREDIEIIYTGLRPGEKLYEEVRLDGESNEPTAHPQIVITKAPQPNEIAVAGWLRICETESGIRYPKRTLRTLIPEFAVPPEEAPDIELIRAPGPAPLLGERVAD